MYLKRIEEQTLLLVYRYLKKNPHKSFDYCLTKTNGVMYIGIRAIVITNCDIPNYLDLYKSLLSLYDKGLINCSKSILISNNKNLSCLKKISLTNIGIDKVKELESITSIFENFKKHFKIFTKKYKRS